MGRAIVVGDVHGCLEELDDLLRTADYRRGRDRLVMAGDMIDRGPDPVGVVRRVMEVGGESVCGNHEEKALRWLRNESKRRSTGRPNLMAPPSESRRREWESLSSGDLSWMRSLPLTVSHGGWLVVHAGFEPGLPMDRQRPDKVMRVRWVGGDGIMVPSDDMRQPDGSFFWMEKWRGPESVLYGHAVHSLASPRTDAFGGFRCVGIDTGCVYGGRLTAAIVKDDDSVELTSVPAKRAYFELRKEL